MAVRICTVFFYLYTYTQRTWVKYCVNYSEVGRHLAKGGIWVRTSKTWPGKVFWIEERAFAKNLSSTIQGRKAKRGMILLFRCLYGSNVEGRAALLWVISGAEKWEKEAGVKEAKWGLPWWCSGWESACQCRGHGFEPWSGRIPHATEHLGPWATTTEPARLEPVLHNERPR